MGRVKLVKTIWGAVGAPIFKFFIAAGGGVNCRPVWGPSGTPNFSFYFVLSPPPKAAVSQIGTGGASTGAPKAPEGGAEDAAPTEGEGNPARGGYFASIS